MLALDMLLIVSALENAVEGNDKLNKVKCQSSSFMGDFYLVMMGRVPEFRIEIGSVL